MLKENKKNYLEKIIMIVLVISLILVFSGRYNRVSQYILIILGAITIFKNGYKKTGIEIPILIFLLGIGCSIFRSLDLKNSWDALYKLFYPLLTTLAITQYKLTLDEKEKVLDFSTVTVFFYFVINIILQILRIVPLYWTDEGRYTKYLVFRDSYDFIIAAITIYFFQKFIFSKIINRKIFWGILSLGGIFLILVSKTKSSWLAIVAVIIIMSFIKVKESINFNKANLVKLVFSIIIILLILITLILSTEVGRYHYTILTGAFDFKHASNSSRIEVWKVAIEFIKNRPIFGYGFKPFFKLPNFEEFHWMWHFHNEYIELLVGTGIVGLSSYIVMYFYIIKYLLKEKTLISYTAFGFVVWGFIYHIVTTDINSLTWWTIWGIFIGLGMNNNKERSDEAR